MPITVYVADDHPVFRNGLRRSIEEDDALEFVGDCEEGEGALAAILDIRPNVAILDIAMPRLSGVEILHELRCEGIKRQEVRVVILTGTEQEDVVYEAMAEGGSAYLLKTSDWDHVRSVVKRVYDGETVIAPEVITALSKRLVGEHTKLTPRELEILTYTASGFTAQKIATKLCVELPTVKTHLRNTYRKLKVTSQAAAVAEAIRQRLID